MILFAIGGNTQNHTNSNIKLLQALYTNKYTKELLLA